MKRNGDSDRKFGHIMFAIAIFFIFFSFALYAGFYRMASFLIRDSVHKTLLWSNLLDRQIAQRAKVDAGAGIVTPIPEPASQSYLRIISPNGGERICLGSDFTVGWESGGLRKVNLFVSIAGASYPLGEFPPDFNETGEKGRGEFVWTAGDTSGGVKLREGLTYEMIITGQTDPRTLQLDDRSDGIFALIRCEG